MAVAVVLNCYKRERVFVLFAFALLFVFDFVNGSFVNGSSSSCNDWPSVCPGTVPTKMKQTWQMNMSTIIMPCNGAPIPPHPTLAA